MLCEFPASGGNDSRVIPGYGPQRCQETLHSTSYALDAQLNDPYFNLYYSISYHSFYRVWHVICLYSYYLGLGVPIPDKPSEFAHTSFVDFVWDRYLR
ncbi:MAG: hypothetical protein IEMM0001_2231 [bacterium]|nr:MAG: hypothetical protein IEMM0001_2231 [bacterium]